jgi:lipopolysaccharide/colanic/teichoic acid biosynthesis glycosyltransferase
VMDIPRLWALPGLQVCAKEARVPVSVHSAEQFHAILEREKARANRNAHQFSLVLFELTCGGECIFQERYLTDSLLNRVRWTDEAGWYGSRHIGIVLPDTSGVGAQRLADRICDVVASKTLAPEYTVYTYPYEPFPNDNGHSKQLRFVDICPQWKAVASRSYSISSDRSFKVNNPLIAQQISTDVTFNGTKQPAEFEPLFYESIQMWKRVFDVLFSIVALIILSPLLLFVSILIKVVSNGPVFFRQKRVGYMGKTFTMLKFRTMKVNNDAAIHRQYITKLINGAKNGVAPNKPMTKLRNHKEWIRFGKILRRMCIDELPQFINVLRGEMSVVGPRPALPYEVAEYLPWHYRRFNTLPGMTGLWQVSGKNRLSFNEMVRLDIRYSRRHSFWLDIKILLKTPFAIITQIIDEINETKVADLRGVGKCLTLR